MSRFAKDDQNFRDAVNQAISLKLTVRAYTLDNITEASFTRSEKADIKGIFLTCAGDGDIQEISSRIATFDYECDELKYAFNSWFAQCFEAEIENQLLILRSDHEPTTNDLGARRA